MSAHIDDDLFSPEAIADPYDYFGRIRETDPVHWNARHRSWLVTRYADVVVAYRERRLSNAVLEALAGREDAGHTYRILSKWMSFTDGSTHARLRRLAAGAFTPKTVQRLEGRVVELVTDLLDLIARKRRIEFMADVAFALPGTVIAELLGVPSSDRETFKSWSDDLMPLVFSSLGDVARHARAEAALLALEAYFHGLIERYRRDPGENLVADLIRIESEGDQLSREELVAMCILLLFAGHETTTGLLGTGLLALHRHPDQLARLRRDPTLIGPAVEEMIRYDGVAKITVRRVADDFELAGRRLRQGERMLLVNAAANHDPRRFPEPGRFDIAREDNTHVGFGMGRHSCLGAPLARLEMRIAMPMLIARFPELQLDTTRIDWHSSLLVRVPLALPVALGP